tara:strand:- start:271 stop:429 length:159 start_codon:yes stop_codon:yes gene_type:complete
MWKRIPYTEWQTLFPIMGFVLFFGAFVAIVWMAVKMKSEDSDRSSRMPLQDD